MDELETPLYIFDTDKFAQRAQLVKEKFGSRTGLCFSIKANPFLLGSLTDVFDRIEVCSPGELAICERVGIDPAKIIFSGVNKTAADVARAMDDGVGTFTAESYLHAELIDHAARERGRKVPVLIRVTGGSQFGMDEQDVLKLINRREDYEGIDFAGLHYFTGTQKKKPALIEKELDYISRFADKIRAETGFIIRKIEYGTGLAVDYFKENADELEAERLAAVSGKIQEIAQKYSLTIEMGRFFAAPCGYYLTRVMDTKTNCGIHYAILDGGLHQLKYDGQIQGMQIPRIIHIKNECAASTEVKRELNESVCGSRRSEKKEGVGRELKISAENESESVRRAEWNESEKTGKTSAESEPESVRRAAWNGQDGVKKWTLCGSLCTTADVLARDVELENLEIGDLLVFCRTGAYSATEGMAVFLSREMPAVALYSEEGGLKMIRGPIYTDKFIANDKNICRLL